MCWASFYNCLPSILQCKCCAPAEDTVITTTETDVKVKSAVTSTHTPPPSPYGVPTQLPTITAVNDVTTVKSNSLTPDQAARLAVITERLQHNRLASTEMVSMTKVLHEGRPATT
jgi:hypothetical protein